MAAGLLPDEGIQAQLEYILSSTITGVLPWELIFWTNDYVPTSATVLSDLVEATFGGYTRLTLDRADWTVTSVGSGCAHAQWGTVPAVWYVTGGPAETLYGVAYVDTSAGVLRFVQRFDAGDIAPVVVGGRVLILPEYTLTSAEC